MCSTTSRWNILRISLEHPPRPLWPQGQRYPREGQNRVVFFHIHEPKHNYWLAKWQSQNLHPQRSRLTHLKNTRTSHFAPFSRKALITSPPSLTSGMSLLAGKMSWSTFTVLANSTILASNSFSSSCREGWQFTPHTILGTASTEAALNNAQQPQQNP